MGFHGSGLMVQTLQAYSAQPSPSSLSETSSLTKNLPFFGVDATSGLNSTSLFGPGQKQTNN